MEVCNWPKYRGKVTAEFSPKSNTYMCVTIKFCFLLLFFSLSQRQQLRPCELCCTLWDFFFKVLNFFKTHQEALEKSQASLEVFGSIPLGLFMWFFSPTGLIPLPFFWDNFVLHATSVYLLYLSWRWWEQIFLRTLKMWRPSVLSNGCDRQIRTTRNTTVHSGPDVVLTLPAYTEPSDMWL